MTREKKRILTPTRARKINIRTFNEKVEKNDRDKNIGKKTIGVEANDLSFSFSVTICSSNLINEGFFIINCIDRALVCYVVQCTCFVYG